MVALGEGLSVVPFEGAPDGQAVLLEGGTPELLGVAPPKGFVPFRGFVLFKGGMALEFPGAVQLKTPLSGQVRGFVSFFGAPGGDQVVPLVEGSPQNAECEGVPEGNVPFVGGIALGFTGTPEGFVPLGDSPPSGGIVELPIHESVVSSALQQCCSII